MPIHQSMVVIDGAVVDTGDGFHQGADASLIDVKRTCKDTKALSHHAESHLDTDAAVADGEIFRIQIINLYSVSRFIT